MSGTVKMALREEAAMGCGASPFGCGFPPLLASRDVDGMAIGQHRSDAALSSYGIICL